MNDRTAQGALGFPELLALRERYKDNPPIHRLINKAIMRRLKAMVEGKEYEQE